ncbi:hypothetical protein PInf_007648 [Phytophthora infestans]|nr:hypothetical protein PInf_007648 [Phytophthora infestans]
MERKLYQFVLHSPNLTQLSDLVLCAKANELLQGQQSVTKSWVFRFKQRHAFSALIDEYEPRDVFNLDETGLFYQMYINAEENVPEWVPFSEELPPAPRSRRAKPKSEERAAAEGEDDQAHAKPFNDAEALTAALQLSAYAFANRIEVPGLDNLIATARERCHNRT